MDNQYTPGPWRWEISLQSKRIQLCGGKLPFDLTIMDFQRWGMQGATPRFLGPDKTNGELLWPAKDYAAIVPGREHHKHWFQTINHPDAHLIAAAPDMIEVLQKMIDLHESGEVAELLDTDTKDVFSKVRLTVQLAKTVINKALNK